MEQDVTRWLEERGATHQTLRLWIPFLLEDYPAYLAFRMGGRAGNYPLCVAALRTLAPIFAATGKTNYVSLCIEHLTNLARMPDSDIETIGTMFVSSFSKKPHTNVFGDEHQEMCNRISKTALTRATMAFFTKVPRITDSRSEAIRQVEDAFMPDGKERDYVPGLIKDRAGAVRK
ncbi:unnamed protein product, partial [Hapterophycus canaliculatus]